LTGTRNHLFPNNLPIPVAIAPIATPATTTGAAATIAAPAAVPTMVVPKTAAVPVDIVAALAAVVVPTRLWCQAPSKHKKGILYVWKVQRT
jgi:hypothetical protein